MCGRYTLDSSGEEIAEAFDLDAESLAGLEPRFNIAPTQDVLVIREPAKDREAVPLRWGLVPHWAKDLAIGNKMINARGETARSKPAFRDAFRSRRCLVPAAGFYEWRRVGKQKHPHLFRPKGIPLFAFAGLWDRWRDPEGQEIDTFTIVTTEANATVRGLHDRMPVIFDPSDYARWLDPEARDLDAIEGLLVPCAPDRLEVFPVSREVNKAGFEDPSCVEPLAEAPH